MTINYIDIAFGLDWGDEGKGKVVAYLAKTNDYDFVCRWNGGPNAGHTVIKDGKKYKTHLIPSGIFYGKKSIIGPDCILNPTKFWQEIEYLKSFGFNTDLIKVSPKTHIITEEHIRKDIALIAKDLGTTSNGIAYCYADKAARIGIQAKDILPESYIWDEKLYGSILCEGAQGFHLDINWGLYPYVTSSVTLPYAACSLGFSPLKIRDIWGVGKIYHTRSGEDPLFPEMAKNTDSGLLKLAELGQEFGVTTGRPRKVKWLNLNSLLRSIRISGANKLIINKCDIFQKAGNFCIQWNEEILKFSDLTELKNFVSNKISSYCTDVKEIIFSGDPEKIDRYI